MKKIFLGLISLMAVAPSMAQETYDNSPMFGKDLNGTARYVGMGGAMEALGADISTSSTNPAGIGMMRHSSVSISGGLVSQSGSNSSSVEYVNNSTTHASFDQMGFVYSARTGRKNFINFGLNYHKSNNFNQLMYAISALDGNSAQNVGAYVMDMDYPNLNERTNDPIINQLNNNVINMNPTNTADANYYWTGGTRSIFQRNYSGYIGTFDLNISGNVNNRFYWGVSLGYSNVNYKQEGDYYEDLYLTTEKRDAYSQTPDNRKITGSGWDLKFGVIFRPVKESPFRVGLYVNTPTLYDLKLEYEADLASSAWTDSPDDAYLSNTLRGTYRYEMRTPWKFGVSLGHTIGKEWAFGATYEYSDYSSTKFRIKDGSYSYSVYDDWGYYIGDTYYETSRNDGEMNGHVSRTLKGVSTLKLGVEYKPMPLLALRLGYNYVSPMFDSNGYKDLFLDSPGAYYTTSTAYTNWKSTNRVTAGVGFFVSKWNFDLAYQYSQTNGDFYPFTTITGYKTDTETINNIAPKVDVSNKRHQLIATIGYTF